MTRVWYSGQGQIWRIQQGKLLDGDGQYIDVKTRPPKDAYVDVATKQVKQKGQAPSADHSFDYKTKTWKLDLEAARSRAWMRIKAARARAERTFKWGEYEFDFAPERLSAAAALAQINPDEKIEWTLADNSTIELTAADSVQVAAALVRHLNEVHARGRLLRRKIEAATSLDELESIQWTNSTI